MMCSKTVMYGWMVSISLGQTKLEEDKQAKV